MGDVHKLPVWAQELIATLQRERGDAVRALEAFSKGQKPTAFHADEGGRQFFIDAGIVYCESAGVSVGIHPDPKGVDIQFRGTERAFGGALIQPWATDHIKIVKHE